MTSLQQADNEAAKHAVAPRVTLKDIEDAIESRFHITAYNALFPVDSSKPLPHVGRQLGILTLCIVVTKSGFTVVGTSAPASPENFNAEFGAKLAYEDCVRQLWPLLGFSLRQRLHERDQQGAAAS